MRRHAASPPRVALRCAAASRGRATADPTHARGATRLTFRFRCTLTQNGEKYQVDQTNSVDVHYLLSVTNAKDPVVWQRVA